MKPETKPKMNPIHPAIQRSYNFAMRTMLALAIMLAGLLAFVSMTSCAGSGLKIPASLPFDIGVRYQLEPGFFIVAAPADKGGIDITLEGEGELGKYVVKDGNVWTITSPKTGIVYLVTTEPGKKPKIEIVGGGNGKLQLVPSTPPPTDPVLTEPPPPPAAEALP